MRGGALHGATLSAAALGAFLVAAPARADDEPAPAADRSDDLWTRDSLLGDIGGLRPAMQTYGLTLDLAETDEILGNPSGGTRQGAIYEGLTDVSLKLDLRPYFHWRGVFYVRALQIHGRGLSANNLDDLNTASSLEADRSTRLSELWYEQHIGDGLRIRLGQQAVDQEFLVSTTAKLFVNATFGWPTLPGTDLPSGGPAYPLATPAARLRVDPNDALTLFAGVFDGNPAGPGLGDPQLRDPAGTAFRVNDGALAIAEIRYNPGNTPQNGTYRFGAWFNSETFPSPEFDTVGVPLTSPQSNGRPRLLGKDWSLYAVVDQPLFHAKDSDRGLAVFARAMGAPGDRNLVDFYLDGGVSYQGLFGRGDDAVGLAFGFARIGSAARQLAADSAGLAGQPYPVRSSETVVELTYRVQIAPWWQVQPDFQYVVNPGGGIPNPNLPAQRIGNAAILGLRTAIAF